MRLLSLQNSKGSSSSALRTWAEGQWRGGCRDKGQDGNASCQSPVALQGGTSAKGQQRVEERALELLSEANLVLRCLSPSMMDRAGVALK